MNKTINEATIKKMIEDSRSTVEAYEVGNGGTACVDVAFSDSTKTTIEITKYIPYEEAAGMADYMGQEIAGEKDGEFTYRPYIKGWLSAFCFLRYFTNIDAVNIDTELLNKFFLYPNEVWKKIQEIAYNIPQFVDILVNVDELIAYNNTLYINTQTQKVEALEKQLHETLDKLESMADMFAAFSENYADMDKETTTQFIDSVNKIMAIDPNETAAKVAALVEESKINDIIAKPKKGRPKKVVEKPKEGKVTE